MIISPQSLDTNLSQLLAEVKSGSMQLPEFQRDWTWDDRRELPVKNGGPCA